MTSLQYEDHKAQASRRILTMSASGRDIGDIPPVVDPARKAGSERSFRAFCEVYFPLTFNLGWSADHLTVIGQIETSVLHGGLFATAMPRGSGKTSLSEVACIWAVLYGHRDFVCLIGSDEDHATQMLDSIKSELESNDRLAEDFPEAVYPIERLEGIAHRCNGQLHKAERTHIGWTAGEIVMPTIPGSKASGAIIKVAGITGGLRGMKFKRPDGKTVRPSLVVVDDPQTDSSARSRSQCQTRERILAGAILGLAGPGRKISGIMPCTVIAPGDMADAILDPKKHPDWNGARTKMVYAWSTAEKRWEEYGRMRADGFRAGDGGAAATEYYREHRAEMDDGAIVAWAERFNEDELSAIQHAYNLRLRDERAFFSEYQNEPLEEEDANGDDLKADQIAAKVNRIPQRIVPAGCTRLTAMIDVQGSLLYYCVAAWDDDFSGYVVDYGTWPDQHRPYFTLRDAKYTFDSQMPGKGVEEKIYAALESLTGSLLDRDWDADGSAPHRIDRCLIDAGYMSEVVNQFCRQSAHRDRLTPSHGRPMKASSLPINQLDKRPGDRFGLNWRSRAVEGKGSVRYVTFDANFWKSFVMARLAVGMGGRGCLSLFGTKPGDHRLFADHLTAEFRIRTEGRGRTVDEWKIRPERPDNHWLDGVVGCAVGASMLGVQIAESTTPGPAPRRQRMSMADMRDRKQA